MAQGSDECPYEQNEQQVFHENAKRGGNAREKTGEKGARIASLLTPEPAEAKILRAIPDAIGHQGAEHADVTIVRSCDRRDIHIACYEALTWAGAMISASAAWPLH